MSRIPDLGILLKPRSEEGLMIPVLSYRWDIDLAEWNFEFEKIPNHCIGSYERDCAVWDQRCDKVTRSFFLYSLGLQKRTN